MRHKSFKPIKAEYGDEGSIRLVFATLNVIDSQGDVTMPGAFTDGAEVLISAYGHSSSWGSALPVGKGSIREVGDQAIFEGQFFLDTEDGQKNYQTVKNVGPLQEFSYGYDPVKRSFGEFEGRDVRFLEQVKVYEVSPVLLGAGVGTRILDIKDGADASRGRFVDHIEGVLDDARDLVERAKSIREKRKEKDRDLSDERKGQLVKAAGEFKNLAQELDAMTQEPVTIDASALFLQSQRTLDRVRTTIGGTA